MTAIVLGSSGLTGALLLRLLDRHPHIEKVYAVSQSQSGTVTDARAAFSKVEGYVALSQLTQLRADVLFSALPHLQSAATWQEQVKKMIIIDLAADLRIADSALFASKYGQAPPPVAAGTTVAYGMTELFSDEVKQADIIANPGCFPTAGLIPLLPLARDGLLQQDLIITAITGISGAGKSRDPNYLFNSRTENSGAYKPGAEHRHWAEFSHYLRGHTVQFVPHLAPLARGIATTIFCKLRSGAGEKDMLHSYAQAYGAAPFVRYTNNRIPQTGEVRGSNRCDYSWRIGSDGQVLLFSAIDNLMKGAAGQAVQNMNIRMGWDESAGLSIDAEL